MLNGNPFFCNFACGLNGGYFDISIGAGGSGDGLVVQFNVPSEDDTSGLTSLPYDLWTDGVTEYLTIYGSLETPADLNGDEHYNR